MGLKIYNSLSNKLEDFIPINGNKVNMYVCGPTVYNYIHIGNARPVIFFDMLKRYLVFLGYDVTYASNITDVDDKIIKFAIKNNITEKEVTEKYTEAFIKNVKDLGSQIPDIMPKATEYIPQMIDFIKQLNDKGYAYEVDGDVYFRVKKVADYGILSNQVSEDLNSGVRIDVSSKKEDPQDFNLWKKTEEGIKWESPFGAGRPGWHTECVVMNNDIFKGEIDIHGGGMDLKFPHHENEIAQANALYNHHLSKYWMHVGRLDMNGEKMSKSLGNLILVNDIEDEDKLMAFRLLIISCPYRSNFNFTDELFSQFEKEYLKIKRTYKQAMLLLDINGLKNELADKSDIEMFKEYMNQDFNTQNVMSLVNKIIKEMNVAMRNTDLNLVAMKNNTLKIIMDVFGIPLKYTSLSIEDKVQYLDWETAKKEKNFEKADSLRNILVEKGIL